MVLIVQLHNSADLSAVLIDRALKGLQNMSGRVEEEQNLLPLPRIRPCLSSYIPYLIKYADCSVPRGAECSGMFFTDWTFRERCFLCYGPTPC